MVTRDYIKEANERVEGNCKVVTQEELAKELFSGFAEGTYKELKATYIGPDGDYLVYRVEKTMYTYDSHSRHADRAIVDGARYAVRWRTLVEE